MVQDVGVSKELAKRAFELKVGEVAGPFDVGTGWAVVRVKEHHDPDMADFDKRKNDLQRQYETSKWERITDDWAKQKCAEVRDEKRIKVNNEVLDYDGGKTPVKYEPCAGTKLF
jgi:parvulin-like peptidyl-prolyl isomerase